MGKAGASGWTWWATASLETAGQQGGPAPDCSEPGGECGHGEDREIHPEEQVGKGSLWGKRREEADRAGERTCPVDAPWKVPQ